MSRTDPSPEFLTALTAQLPADTRREVLPAYLEEPRGRYHGRVAAVFAPATVELASLIVKACADARVGVVPYAGGTGLVAGQVALEDPVPILLSMERMTRVRAVDPVDNVMIAEAGVILADARQAADSVGRLFPLSLASEGSCRIGGNLATNAGGVNVLRYGNARDLCLGLEAVLPDGTILRGLKRLRKDNTGYDLRHLLIGSEGTLGLITAASLRLFPQPGEVATAMVIVPSPQAALDLLSTARDGLGETVSAYELLHAQGYAFLAEKLPMVSQPFADPPEWSVLIEVGGPVGFAHDGLEKILALALDAGLASDALIAQNAAQAQAFWRLRETIPEANRLVGAISSHDISVPVSQVPAFIAAAEPMIAAMDPGLRINCFGHLGDGNLHYNVFPAAGRTRREYDLLRDQIKVAVHDLVHAFDGSISAEHGIGRLKTDDLLTYGDPGKLAAMRAIKSALDPHGIMNPGAVLG